MKSTAVLALLPTELIPEDYEVSSMIMDYPPSPLPIVPGRHDDNAVVEEKVVLLKKWFDDELRATMPKDGQRFVAACFALPALSLSVPLWSAAVAALADKLKEFDEVAGIDYKPRQLGLNIDTKYAVADLYVRLPKEAVRRPVFRFATGKPPVEEDETEKKLSAKATKKTDAEQEGN